MFLENKLNVSIKASQDTSYVSEIKNVRMKLFCLAAQLVATAQIGEFDFLRIFSSLLSEIVVNTYLNVF